MVVATLIPAMKHASNKVGVQASKSVNSNGVSNLSNVTNKTGVQNILYTMSELTGTNREKLLSTIQNKNLKR